MPEITLQPTEATAIDTYIDEGDPAAAFTNAVNMEEGHGAAGNNKDIFLKFDLISIPPGSVIEVATLSLWLEGANVDAAPSRICRIASGNSGWTEACTWNTKDGAVVWVGGAPGCEVTGVDYVTTPMWEGNAGIVVGWHNFSLNITEVQALLDIANYGFKYWALDRNAATNKRLTYTSSSGANKPKLYIRWREPTTRLVRYEIDVWDIHQQIRDSEGRTVPFDEVEADSWIRLIGAGTLTSKVYTTLIEDPLVSYIESVAYRMDSDTIMIRASKESMLRAFMKRLGGMTT